jgi:uncharacterized Zn finger protein (UPF0148 family)
MKKMDCPICGTKKRLIEKEKKIKIEYAQEKGSVKIKYFECPSCGASFDLSFEKENEKKLKKELSLIRQKNVSKVLSSLEKDFSFVEMERNFKLPPRTLSKWKTGAKIPSAAAVNLINLVGIFPWLSYVAASDYDLNASYKIADIAFLKRAELNNNIIFTYSNNYYNILGFAERKKHISRLKDYTLLNITSENIVDPQYSINEL